MKAQYICFHDAQTLMAHHFFILFFKQITQQTLIDHLHSAARLVDVRHWLILISHSNETKNRQKEIAAHHCDGFQFIPDAIPTTSEEEEEAEEGERNEPNEKVNLHKSSPLLYSLLFMFDGNSTVGEKCREKVG